MLPRGLRNNNPGNIEDGPFAQGLPGYVGSDGRFAQFETLDHGFGAMSQLYNRGGYKGLNTINDIIGRWAPTSDGNDVPAYASYVSKRMGVGPNAPLNKSDPAQMQALARAQAEYENGTSNLQGVPMPQPGPQQGGAMPDLYSAQQPTQQSPGPDWGGMLSGIGAGLVTAVNPGAGAQLQGQFNEQMLKNRPQLVDGGTDWFGNKRYMLYDPRSQQFAPVNAAKALSAAQGGSGSSASVGGGFGAGTSEAYGKFQQAAEQGASGEQLFGTLPKLEQNVIQRMLSGEERPPSGMAMSKPGVWQARVMAASAIDPHFDTGVWAQRNKTWLDYASGGKNGQTINAIDTADNHFANAMKSAEELGNTPLPALNWLKNGLLKQTGDPRVDKFQSSVNAITTEMIKAYNSGHITDSELARWRETLNSDKSPQQLYSTLSEWHDLLQGKRKALADQYGQIMGRDFNEAHPPPTAFRDAAAKSTLVGGGQQSPGQRPPLASFFK